MNLRFDPVVFLRGALALPASKSYSIRAFLIAACGGNSQIINPSNCDDARVAREVARALGAKVSRPSSLCWQLNATSHRPVKKIKVGESGTVLRFVLPLLALRGASVKVEGRGTLRGRPNQHLVRVLRDQGVDIHGQGASHSIPIVIRKGTLKGGRIKIEGTLSSQFISSLLIACPQLTQDTELMITGKRLVSGDYIEMTLGMLKDAGIKIIRKGERRFLIPGGQQFKGLKKFAVPSDSGLAAFLLAAGCLLPSKIILRGALRPELIQADSQIFAVLRRMGARLHKTARQITIQGPFVLRGGEFSLESSPDLVPIVAVLALFAKGRTRIYNIAHARAKESDRISDLRQELLKVGARIEERANELIIHPQSQYRTGVVLDPHHDHRLAMAFAVLGAKIGATVKDIECTAKSYPDFVRDFRKLGAKTAPVR